MSTLIALGASLTLFIGITIFCVRTGLFRYDKHGVLLMFNVIIYTTCWAIPSFAIWVLLATIPGLAK